MDQKAGWGAPKAQGAWRRGRYFAHKAFELQSEHVAATRAPAGVHIPGTLVPIGSLNGTLPPPPPPSAAQLALQAADEEWEKQRLEELRTVRDRQERLVRAIAAFMVVTDWPVEGVGGRRTTEPKVMLGSRSNTLLVDRVVPGWNPSCEEVANYNDGDVARWFADEARRQADRYASTT